MPEIVCPRCLGTGTLDSGPHYEEQPCYTCEGRGWLEGAVMPGTKLTKPANCTCAYPELVARNMCGHSMGCPVYAEWRAKVHPGEVAIFGVCPTCGGTRPTCCSCPDHDQPTHYAPAYGSVSAGNGPQGVVVSASDELFRTHSNNLWSLWRRESDGWRALLVDSRHEVLDSFLRGYQAAQPQARVRSGNIREIETEMRR